jgi:hypothetical protein
MKQYSSGMFMSLVIMFLVIGGLSRADGADISNAGGNWDEESAIEWIPAKFSSLFPSKEQETPSLIEQVGAVEDIPSETSFISHQSHRGACCPGAPCDWLTPCGGWNFEAQSLWLRVQTSEDEFRGASYDNGTRFILGHTDACGRTWRGRYFNYFSRGTTEFYSAEYADFEYARRFAWSGGIYGELSAGLRWAQFNNNNFVRFSDTIGPVIGGELRGLSFYGWDAYASARHSLQFGKDLDDRDLASFSVTEVQLGMLRNFTVLGHPTFAKGFLEAQQWTAASNDSESVGLVGFGVGLGMTF